MLHTNFPNYYLVSIVYILTTLNLLSIFNVNVDRATGYIDELFVSCETQGEALLRLLTLSVINHCYTETLATLGAREWSETIPIKLIVVYICDWIQETQSLFQYLLYAKQPNLGPLLLNLGLLTSTSIN